jgi:hypothetical protein
VEFVPVVAMGLLTLKLIDFARYLTAPFNVNGVVTQLAAWLFGIVVLALVAHTNWAGGIDIGGFPLSKLSGWSLVFYGMATASAASAFNDVRPQRIPALVGPSSPPASAGTE